MLFELPWVGGAPEDAMAVAIYIKYALSLNSQFTYYWRGLVSPTQ